MEHISQGSYSTFGEDDNPMDLSEVYLKQDRLYHGQVFFVFLLTIFMVRVSFTEERVEAAHVALKSTEILLYF